MKLSFFIVLFLVVYINYGQNDTISWKGYFSYFNVQQIEEAETELIVAAENSFFSYDLALKP